MSITLTPREEDVARCIRECMSSKQIASHLGISVSTVRLRLHKIYRKIGVPTGEVRAGSRMRLLRWLMSKEEVILPVKMKG
jgi:DNA-binding NarL/FixJ family response regulator